MNLTDRLVQQVESYIKDVKNEADRLEQSVKDTNDRIRTLRKEEKEARKELRRLRSKQTVVKRNFTDISSDTDAALELLNDREFRISDLVELLPDMTEKQIHDFCRNSDRVVRTVPGIRGVKNSAIYQVAK